MRRTCSECGQLRLVLHHKHLHRVPTCDLCCVVAVLCECESESFALIFRFIHAEAVLALATETNEATESELKVRRGGGGEGGREGGKKGGYLYPNNFLSIFLLNYFPKPNERPRIATYLDKANPRSPPRPWQPT